MGPRPPVIGVLGKGLNRGLVNTGVVQSPIAPMRAKGNAYLEDFKAHNRLGLFRNKPTKIAPYQP